ncbi:MAG: molybdopterin molybdotransferase MoeA [Rhodothermales bacterium]|nr:molybdopterin molybdotransferase MoeA [Rhodothermales bacterium]
MRTFISFREALEAVLAAGRVTAPETVPVELSIGRVIADHVEASENLPSFASSAMDGYAVRSDDCRRPGAVLRVTGEVPAGTVADSTVERGTCMRIMTGAPVPPGSDGIAPIEWSEPDGDDRIRVDRAVDPGKFVRPAGEDVSTGDVIARRGDTVTPALRGLFAGLGVSTVPVRRMPSVAVITTGTEVVDPGLMPAPGQIRNMNGPVLTSLVDRAGGRCDVELHASDDRTALEDALARAAGMDLIVISGGVSVGEYDLVYDVLSARGFEAEFWKVRQRPGKPLLFGQMAGTPVIGLPGNPVSTYVGFEVYVRPLLRTMLGVNHPGPVLLPARLANHISKPDGLHTFARGFIQESDAGSPVDRLTVHSTGNQRSNLLGSIARADCLIHLPEAWDDAPAGAEVMIQLLGT